MMYLGLNSVLILKKNEMGNQSLTKYCAPSLTNGKKW